VRGSWYTADVVQDFHNWTTKQPNAPIGGAVGFEQFKDEKGVGPRAFKHLQEQEGGGQPLEARRKKALTADPDHAVSSKSPSMVHVEFANRMGSGSHPDDVYQQIIAEIADHLNAGQINNRDAHRAANEAFGRLLMAKKRTGSRKEQAWVGWGPDQAPKRHKVAGWDWDQHLNGFISNKPRQFECSCGEPVNVPDYHNCKCGKIWNTYVIGTGGDRHEASAEKFIAREIPNREKNGESIVVAKKQATDHFHDGDGRYTGPMKMKRPADILQGEDLCPECGSHYLEPHEGHEVDERWAKKQKAKPPNLQSANDDDYSEIENNNPFPSKHQPRKSKDNRAKGVTDGTTSPDWHKRDHSSQQWLS
jgi:hypothetical protein